MSGHWANSNRARRLPPNWAAIRQRILRRDGWRCTWVEHGSNIRCAAPATEVHHINADDDHSAANLASLCSYHHHKVTSAEANAARHSVSNRRPLEQHPGLTGGGPPSPPT
jgi:5-methylcytosine-specific restriction protein A